jgi:hypothetical protein
MANIHPDIKPGGLTQHRETHLMYMLAAAIEGICTKLDADGGVPLTTYLANCYTAIFNMAIEAKNHYIHNFVREENFMRVSAPGLDDKSRLEFMHHFHNMLETLTEQLDTDVLTDSDYEALCYTALMLHQVENQKGSTLGNGTEFYFRPGGVMNQKELVEWYFNAVNAIETLTEKLDDDGTVTDTDYEALWFTAVIPMRVENGAGSVAGNTSTDRG